MLIRHLKWSLPVVAALAFTLPAGAQEKPKPIEIAKINRPAGKPVSYINEVVEILENKCTGCHNDALAENKLKLETVEQMLKGGKSGPSVVKGKADDSLLFKMGSHRLEPVMPPKDKKELKPWTPEETALIKLWIDQGAKDDTDSEPAAKPKPALVLGELPAKFAPIYALDLSPNEQTLAVARGAKLHLVEPVSGLVFAAFGGHKDAIQSVRFRPDSRELAAGSYGVVTRWELPATELKKSLEKMPFETTAIAGEPGTGNLWAASAKEPKLRLIEPSTGKEIKAISFKTGLARGIARSSFEPLVAIIDDAGTSHIHNTEKGDEIQLLKPTAPVKYTAAAWLAKSRLALAQADGKIQVMEIIGPGKDGAKKNAEITAGQGAITRLVPAAKGKLLAAVVDDKAIEVIDVDQKKSVRSLPFAGEKISLVNAMADGTQIVGQADGVVTLYSDDFATKKAEDRTGSSPVVAASGLKTAGQALLFYQNGLVRLVKLPELSTVWAFNGRGVNPSATAVNVVAAAVGPNDEITVAAKDLSWKVWSLSGKLAAKSSLEGHVDRVLAIDYSPDGKKMATTGGQPSRTGEVKLWNVETGAMEKSLDALHSDTVFGIRFSPDGKFIATCAADKFAKITQLSDFKTLRPLEGHTNHVLGLDWKPDGKAIATAGADLALKLWNVETGEQLRTAQSAGKQITAVRWSATKPLVVGTSGDKIVRFWNPDNGQISRTFSGANDFLFAVAFSKDASAVYSAGQNGTLQVWNGNDAKLIRTLEFAPAAAGVAKK
jgi:WD40 repeat protein